MAYQSVTLAQLLVQLSARTEGHPWWTAEQARLAINEGLRIWNAATGRWVVKTLIPCVPEDPFIPVPSALGPAVRVLWNNVPLEKGSLHDLDYGIPNWRAGIMGVSGYEARPVYWAPVALNLIVIHPATSVGSFPTTVEVAGLQRTPILILPGDFVDLGEELHDVLLGYALHVLTFSMGGQHLPASYPWWMAFLKAAAADNQQFAATGFYRRLMGLDVSRWLKRQSRSTQNPVDRVVESQVEEG